MAHPYDHAKSSAKAFGGKPEDYLKIHNFLDSSKAHLGNFKHRALYHHTQGIFLCEELFGGTLINSDGKTVPVRPIAEQHIMEDCGYIPTVADWLSNIQPQSWMRQTGAYLNEEGDLQQRKQLEESQFTKDLKNAQEKQRQKHHLESI